MAPYFVLVVVLLLASMVWAIWDEVYTRRPWKGYQKQFFALARRKYEGDLAAAQKALKSDEYQRLKKESTAAARRYENSEEVKKARAEVERLENELKKVREDLQLVRGDYQATIYKMEHTTNPAARERLYRRVARAEPAVYRLLAEMEELQERKRKQQDKLTDLANRIKKPAEDKVASFETPLREAELGLTAVQREKVEIRQVFNNDLEIVDRCQSCHVAATRRGFDDKKFNHPFRSHPDVFFLPVAEKAEGETAKPNVENQNSKPEPPRLHNILAVHPPEQFGCSPCHRGQGFAASSLRDAHGELEFVQTPLLRGAFAQATCLKCHVQETELKGAPVLNEGRRLFVDYGCIGCHTVAQLTPEEADRQVAPDLREIREKLITPEWLLNWVENPKKFRPTTKMPHFDLTREQSVQVASYLWQNAEKPTKEAPSPAPFPPNVIQAGKALLESVGCLACHSIDKQGKGEFAPDLSRVGEKMRYDYLVSWLMDPKKHQPKGLMPRLRLTQQEASNIAAYLTTKQDKSKAQNLRSQVNLDDPVAARQGKALIEHYGCFGCHPIKGMEGRSRIGAELSQFGSKSVELLDYGLLEEKVLHHVNLHRARDNVAKARIAWVMQKLKDPRSYDEGRYKKFKDKLRMPNFGFNERQIRAVTTFLMGLTDEEIPLEWRHQLDERKQAVAKGLRLIRRQNCIGCHQFELETLTFARDSATYHLQGVTKIEEEGTVFFQLWKDAPALEQVASGMVDVQSREILQRTRGLGGDLVPLIIDHWVKKANLVPEEARSYAPPLLAGEGIKVQSPWLFEFLKEPITLRPWLQVRMPTFDLSDEEAAALTRYFTAVDRAPFPYRLVEEREPAYIAKRRREDPDYYARARRLMGDEAHQCGSCHVRGALTPDGDPSDWAPDLELAPRRLQPEWIFDWLKNPQSIYPGTKMPQFPWGEFPEIFPGSGDKQMQAVKDLLMSGQLAAPMVASAKR